MKNKTFMEVIHESLFDCEQEMMKLLRKARKDREASKNAGEQIANTAYEVGIQEALYIFRKGPAKKLLEAYDLAKEPLTDKPSTLN